MTALVVTIDSFVILLLFGCWLVGTFIEWLVERSRDNNRWRQAYYREAEAHHATLDEWRDSIHYEEVDE